MSYQPDFVAAKRTDAARDGRNLRRERSRRAMVLATLSLIEEGTPTPTAQQIAERAGVSLRLVYDQFENLMALYAETALHQGRRAIPYLQPIDPALSFDERLAEFVEMRNSLYELVNPFRRSVLTRFHADANVAPIYEELRAYERRLATDAFATEIEALPAGDRRTAMQAVGGVTSWETWTALRIHQRLGADATKRAMRFALEALLVPRAVRAKPRRSRKRSTRR